MQKEIYIIRHGQTDFNKRGIIQGSGINSVLNEMGMQQARAFYEHYRHHPFELVVTSALQRTHQTVAGFIERGTPWIKLEEINEISWGRYEGVERGEETIRVFDSIVKAWRSGDFDARPEEGESALELQQRLQRFVDTLIARPESKILVCTHGRTMRCLMAMLEGQDLRQMDNYDHDNTGLYKVRYRDNRFQTLLSNNLDHLQVIS